MWKTTKPPRSKLVKKCDRLFSIYTRLHYADKDLCVRCFTCGKKMKLSDQDCTCWHRISRAVQFLRRDFNNARPQCMWRCNSKLSGNGEPLIFRNNLVSEIGLNEVENLENQYFTYRKDPTKFKVYTREIEEKIKELTELIHIEEERLWIKVKL